MSHDDDGDGVTRRPGGHPAPDGEAEDLRHGFDGVRDRGVADDFHQRLRQLRLQEDFQRTSGQARVDGELRTRGVGKMLAVIGKHPQQHRLAVDECSERSSANGLLRALAADETLDRAVAQHDRVVTGTR